MFVLGVSAGLLAAGALSELLPSSANRDGRFIGQVRDLAAETFVEELDPDDLVDAALRGMIDGLDDYSHYYARDELRGLRRETDGEFRGIGVIFRRPTRDGRVLFPYPDAPASRAGMRVGDTILSIDGVQLAELEPGGLQDRIQGAGDASIELEVRGLQGDERTLAITPQKIVDPTVRHVRMLDTDLGVGYVALLSFSHQSLNEFDRAMEELAAEGVRTLIFDLRGNPGGILESAVGIANRFLAEGTIVSTRSRDGIEVTEAEPDEATHAEMGLVILIDGGSASASEVLTGALQDHARAVVVGEATYGKGTVQTLTPISKGRAVVKLTTARYYTPAGRSIERISEDEHGIEPDVHVPISQEERQNVITFLRSYSPPPSLIAEIRAWESTEDVVLIPAVEKDRQLEVALALARGAAPEEAVVAR